MLCTDFGVNILYRSAPRDAAFVTGCEKVESQYIVITNSFFSKVTPATAKNLFTVDELDRLPKLDFINKFTSCFMDSDDFVMRYASVRLMQVLMLTERIVFCRCRLIKNCPFIISRASKSECYNMMFVHLKGHIGKLRAQQEGLFVCHSITRLTGYDYSTANAFHCNFMPVYFMTPICFWMS